MKKIYIIGFLLISLNLSSDELSWVDTQIDAIKPNRSGLNYSSLSSIKTPVIFLKKNKTIDETIKKKTTNKEKQIVSFSSKKMGIIPQKSKISKKRANNLIVDAIINNSALISGKWYTLNDTVRNYKLSAVHNTSVILTKNGESIKLSTRSKNKTLNIKK